MSAAPTANLMGITGIARRLVLDGAMDEAAARSAMAQATEARQPLAQFIAWVKKRPRSRLLNHAVSDTTPEIRMATASVTAKNQKYAAPTHVLWFAQQPWPSSLLVKQLPLDLVTFLLLGAIVGMIAERGRRG